MLYPDAFGAAFTPIGQKPAAWDWRPELLSDDARSLLGSQFKLQPFWQNRGFNTLGLESDFSVVGTTNGWVALPRGEGYSFNGSGYLDSTINNISPTTEWTIVAVFTGTAFDVYDEGVFGNRESGTNDFIQIVKKNDSHIDVQMQRAGTETTARGGTAISVGQRVVVVGTWGTSDGLVRVYLDGVEDGTSSPNTETSALTGQDHALQIASYFDDSGRQFAADYELTFITDKQWSAEQVSAFSRDPAMLLRPDPAKVLPMFFVPAAAGGANPLGYRPFLSLGVGA